MESLSKLELNNTIVLLRKFVRQAKVHSINKLSREIKKLKEKKGSDQQKNKNQRKSARYSEEIQIIKKLPEDEVSRFSLTDERGLTSITNDISTSIEIRAIARLAYHKSVQDKIASFRNKYPNWKNSIHVLMDTLGEKYKHKKLNKKKNRRKKRVQSPAISKMETASGTWTVELVKVNQDKNKFGSTDHPVSDNVKANQNINKLIETKEIGFTKKQSEVKHKVSDGNGSHCPKKATNLLPVNVVKDSTISMSEINSRENSNIIASVDPFFLKKNQTEYISISEPCKSTSDIKSTSIPSLVTEPSFSSNVKQNLLGFSKKSQVFTRKKQGSQNSSCSMKKNPEFESKTLHPSWEAKKKQTQLVKFQGTKIKFE